MGELLLPLVPAVVKARRRRQGLHLRFVADQEIPALLGDGAAIGVEVIEPLLRGALDRVARIEADDDDPVLVTSGPGSFFISSERAVDHQRAEHRALVVGEHQQHGALAVEVLPDGDGAAVLIAEGNVARELGAVAILDVDPVELRRNIRVLRRRRARADERCQREEKRREEESSPGARAHGYLPPRAAPLRRRRQQAGRAALVSEERQLAGAVHGDAHDTLLAVHPLIAGELGLLLGAQLAELAVLVLELLGRELVVEHRSEDLADHEHDAKEERQRGEHDDAEHLVLRTIQLALRLSGGAAR